MWSMLSAFPGDILSHSLKYHPELFAISRRLNIGFTVSIRQDFLGSFLGAFLAVVWVIFPQSRLDAGITKSDALLGKGTRSRGRRLSAPALSPSVLPAFLPLFSFYLAGTRTPPIALPLIPTNEQRHWLRLAGRLMRCALTSACPPTVTKARSSANSLLHAC